MIRFFTALGARRQYLVFLGLVALVVAAGFALGRPRRKAAGLLSAVPRDAWLVVTVDVAALRVSPVAQPVLESIGGTRIPGFGSVSAACGFDPLARATEFAIVSPENGEKGEFGVAFSGGFTKDELVACARRVVLGRGGSPSTSSRRDFTVIEDANDATHGRLAYRDGGPYLVGRGGWLYAMIDAVDGRDEGLRPEHGSLREALSRAASAATGPQPAIVLTALLPRPLRDRLRADLGSELSRSGVTGGGVDAFAGVLSVDQAGVSVTTGGPGSTTEAMAELRCEQAAACDEVKKLIERKRQGWSRDFSVRLIGLGPLLDTLVVEAHAAALSITTRVPTDDLANTVRRFLDLREPMASSPADAALQPPVGP
jgi:hypothetical protein